MKCPQCRHNAPAGAKFCPECGTALPGACASCAHELPPGAKFCPECGQRTSPGPPPVTARFESPAVYTPKHLAEKIRGMKESLEGERKQVTVLFADLRGSMELLAEPRSGGGLGILLDSVLELDDGRRPWVRGARSIR